MHQLMDQKLLSWKARWEGKSWLPSCAQGIEECDEVLFPNISLSLPVNMQDLQALLGDSAFFHFKVLIACVENYQSFTPFFVITWCTIKIASLQYHILNWVCCTDLAIVLQFINSLSHLHSSLQYVQFKSCLDKDGLGHCFQIWNLVVSEWTTH